MAVKNNFLTELSEYVYTWQIPLINCDAFAPGQSIDSPFFTTGDQDEFKWQLKMFPSGFHEGALDYISVYLACVRNLSTQRLHVTISLLDSQKNEKNSKDIFLIDGEFTPMVHFEQFVRRDAVQEEENDYLTNDQLTIKCSVYHHLSKVAKKCSVLDRLREFDSFQQLIESSKYSDVKLIAGDKEFYAHKNILAIRSPVFSRIFEESADLSIVEIPKLSKDGAKEFLRFIYAGKVNDIKIFGAQLLIAANTYEIIGLKNMCEEALIDILDANNAAEFFILADHLGAGKLRAHAINTIIKYRKDVMRNKCFEALMNSCPTLIKELIEKI